MTVTADLLGALVDAGGSIPRDELKMPAASGRSQLSRLVSLGFVVPEYRITDEGREFLASDCPRTYLRRTRAVTKLSRGLDCLDNSWQRAANPSGPYPVASTDEQITELKRKADADRSFGFESINGREARK